jgi:hypothetical protein
VYHVQVAAALWCGVPADQINDELRHAVPIGQSNALGRAILRHPSLRCLEPRIRAIHAAIDEGELPTCREDGRKYEGHVGYERRHVYGLDLKEWAKKIAPSERPTFLFDEIERDTHPAISAESYGALKAAHDAKEHKLLQLNERIRQVEEEKGRMHLELQGLRAVIEKMNTPGERSEKTYLNMIGGLLALMLGKSPAGNRQSSFENQSAIISAMLGHYEHIKGMGDSNLEKIMADANKTLKDSVLTGG